MCQLKIKNIGAIRKVEFNVKRFTMVIGPESSGKSTIAKLLCNCEWVEKRCYTNHDEISLMEKNFLANLQEYHRMDGYIGDDSFLQYIGAYVTITLQNREVTIEVNPDKEETYLYPKVCYIPSERNFAATVPNLNKYNESNDNIMYFLYDWDAARKFIKDVDLKGILNHDIAYRYDSKSKEDLVYEGELGLKLRNASSGIQSVIPLITTVEYELTGVYNRIHPLTLEQKEQAESFMKLLDEIKQATESVKTADEVDSVSKRENLKSLMDRLLKEPAADLVLGDTEAFSENLSRKFFFSCSNLFIEEPEQNIFPRSQERLLYWLVAKVLNSERKHTAFVTTHSPFLLFALNNCLMGNLVKGKLPKGYFERMQSSAAWAEKDLIAVYELHDGELKPIQDQDGLLMDNYLNKAYKQISSEYLQMLTYYGD